MQNNTSPAKMSKVETANAISDMVLKLNDPTVNLSEFGDELLAMFDKVPYASQQYVILDKMFDAWMALRSAQNLFNEVAINGQQALYQSDMQDQLAC